MKVFLHFRIFDQQERPVVITQFFTRGPLLAMVLVRVSDWKMFDWSWAEIEIKSRLEELGAP